MGDLRPIIDELLEALRKQGGFGYVALTALAESGDRTAAGEIYEMAWEQLHSGPWSEVHSAWRDAFSLACLLLSNCIERDEGDLEQCLKYLDMGLIMGGLVFRAHLESAISRAQKAREDDEEDDSQTGNGGTGDESEQNYRNRSFAESLKKLPSGSLSQARIRATCLPSLETFAREFFLPGEPVVIKRAMLDWPALTKWKNLEYLRRIAGSRTVPVEIGEHYLAPGWKQELMTIGDLINRCTSSELSSTNRPYLAQHSLFDQIPELRKDIIVPDYCALGGGDMKSVNAWFGPANTVTPLHHDPHHNLFAQVVGQKYVRLYSPAHSSHLYPFAESMLMNSSQVDLDGPDLLNFPEFEKASGMEYILEEGDMLYIPPKWWHYVKSLSPSFSVSFWWAVTSSVSSDTESYDADDRP
ncbi:[protein]-arginine 3-hydroxylase / protease [Marchantia polymorpha subsp. ruderalis]|uniref:JmjC domain-containing protein n=2 Tax=Marchantia polymorpha TaxID=3197 RepID=A0AAF6AN57_MARPO|nr:hypothetical protein MARPO_0036s0149 [Marchantia polymorpha]BBM97877.1 hypothetical protein Mp_1g09090 [Marchantia polymorpha subsp. ruderalis]|eukprot:PTQ41178.1 hypothetical protein MARPO_0036s0149 [Marchantia polymorpha]